MKRPPLVPVFLFIGAGVLMVALTFSLGNRESLAKFPDFGSIAKLWQSSPPMPKRTDKTVHTVVVPASTSGDMAARIKLLDQAAKQLALQIGQHPDDASLRNRIGMIYLSLGETDQAQGYFRTAVDICRAKLAVINDELNKAHVDKDEGRASQKLLDSSQLMVELSAAHSNLARVYEQTGQHDKVLAELDMLNTEGLIFSEKAPVRTAKAAEGKFSPRVAKHIARAESLLRSNRIPQAVEEYRQALAISPNLPVAHERLGLICALNNDVSGAIEEWEQAVKTDNPSGMLLSNLGVAYYNMGMQGDAKRAFERALLIDPKLVDAAINLSNIYSSQNQMSDAIAVLRIAATHSPKSARTQNNLGMVLALSGQNAAAIGAYRKAIRLDPNMASAHYGMGLALMNARDYAHAVKEFRSALAINPSMHEAHAKMNEASKRAGTLGGRS